VGRSDKQFGQWMRENQLGFDDQSNERAAAMHFPATGSLASGLMRLCMNNLFKHLTTQNAKQPCGPQRQGLRRLEAAGNLLIQLG